MAEPGNSSDAAAFVGYEIHDGDQVFLVAIMDGDLDAWCFGDGSSWCKHVVEARRRHRRRPPDIGVPAKT